MGLGTRLAGIPAASRRMRPPGFPAKPSSTASAGMSATWPGPGALPAASQPLAPLHGPRQGVHAGHRLDRVARAGPAGLRAGAGHPVPAPGGQVRLPGQGGAAPPEGAAVLGPGQDGISLLLPELAPLVQQGGVVHEPAGLAQDEPSGWALNLEAHSHEDSPERSRGSQVTQLQGPVARSWAIV